MKNIRRKYTVLQQICNLIPPFLILTLDFSVEHPDEKITQPKNQG